MDDCYDIGTADIVRGSRHCHVGRTAACGTSGSETASLALKPIPAKSARVLIERDTSYLYSGTAASIGINGEIVSMIASGGKVLVDISAGQTTATASGFGFPGIYTVKFNAEPGRTYTLAVSPRGESYIPMAAFGFVGSAVDALVNENGGAFQIQVAKSS